MARGGGRRTYVRDGNGRFASTPGGGPSRTTPKARRAATRAGNRLNRDNSGRISGIGRDGATVRGGRLKTAKGNRRATQTASMKAAGFRGSTIAKGGRGVSGTVARSLAAARKERAGVQAVNATPMSRRVPAAQRPGSLTSTLRGTLRAVARADAARIRELEAITGGKVRPTAAGARAASEAGARVRGTAKGGKVAATLRAGLRELAQSDARTAREMASIVRDATPKVAGAKGGKVIRGRAALPAARPAAAKASAKPAKPVNNKPKRSLAVRVAKADKADRKLRAQLKQAKASGNLKKENELIRRMQRIDRFNKTYNFADLKASRKALTPAKKPTAPKRTRANRPAGTVAKPRGMKPGVLAARRGVKAEAAKPQPQNKGPKGKKRWLSNDQVIQANEARGSDVRYTAQVMRSKLPKKTATALGTSTLGGYIARISGKPLSFDTANKVSDQIEKITGVGRGQLQGVRKSIDYARKTVTYSLSPVARKQAAIAEKVGSRKPRRRSKP